MSIQGVILGLTVLLSGSQMSVLEPQSSMKNVEINT